MKNNIMQEHLAVTVNLRKANNKSAKLHEILFWFVWPFGALLRSLKYHRRTSSKLIVWLFCIYFGSVFIVPEDKPGAPDSARYSRELIKFHENPLSFSTLFSSIYTTSTYYVDIYQPLVTWLVASFTDNPRWLFLIFSAVFGFFYVNNLWIILDALKKQFKFQFLLYLIVLALVIPLWYINGVRMYTAAQILLYGILQLFIKGNKRGIIYAGLSVFVHFSFLFPFAVFLIYTFIPKSIYLLFSFYIFTSVYHEVNIDRVRSALLALPEVFHPRIKGYTDKGRIAFVTESQKKKSWHVRFADIANRYILYLWTVLIFIKRKIWLFRQYHCKLLFGYALFLGGLTNLTSSIASGGRFFILSDFILYLLICLYLTEKIRIGSFEKLAKLSVPVLIFIILYKIRLGFDYFGLLLFTGNMPLAFFIDTQEPLIQFLKTLF